MGKHTQTIRRQKLTNCLSVFDHFVRLALKRLVKLLFTKLAFYITFTGFPKIPIHYTSHNLQLPVEFNVALT